MLLLRFIYIFVKQFHSEFWIRMKILYEMTNKKSQTEQKKKKLNTLKVHRHQHSVMRLIKYIVSQIKYVYEIIYNHRRS